MANGNAPIVKILPIVTSIFFGLIGVGFGIYGMSSNANHDTLKVSIDGLKENFNEFKTDVKSQLNNIMIKLDTKADKKQ